MTEEQLSQCRDIFGGHKIHPEYTLFRLDSLFFVNFSTTALTAVGDALYPFRVQPFVQYTGEQYFPWSGMSYIAFKN